VKCKSAASHPRKDEALDRQGSEIRKQVVIHSRKKIIDEQRQGPKLGKVGGLNVAHLNVPHTSAELGDNISALVRVTQGQERCSFGWQRRTSLGRTLSGLATSGSTNHSILASLLELLTTPRAIRSGSRLMSTSTVGCQVGIVNCGDFKTSANIPRNK
jgi:hypothetical protein